MKHDPDALLPLDRPAPMATLRVTRPRVAAREENMKLPHVNASSAVYLEYTDSFEGAGEAWADAEIITPAQAQAVTTSLGVVNAAASKLRACSLVSDGAGRAATKARARYRVRDVILDLRVMNAGDALLNGLCGRDRGHPHYRFVFDGGTAGDITGARIREEPELVLGVLARLAKVDDFPGKQAAADLLGDAAKRSLATRGDLDAAETAENDAGNDELYARIEVRKALEQAYGILIAAFPGQRAFVESFFLKAPRTADKAGADTQTPAPAAPATPAPATPATPATP